MKAKVEGRKRSKPDNAVPERGSKKLGRRQRRGRERGWSTKLGGRLREGANEASTKACRPDGTGTENKLAETVGPKKSCEKRK
eukprot:6193055-Pleurochrysis_carterae.AAC.1